MLMSQIQSVTVQYYDSRCTGRPRPFCAFCTCLFVTCLFARAFLIISGGGKSARPRTRTRERGSQDAAMAALTCLVGKAVHHVIGRGPSGAPRFPLSPSAVSPSRCVQPPRGQNISAAAQCGCSLSTTAVGGPFPSSSASLRPLVARTPARNAATLGLLVGRQGQVSYHSGTATRALASPLPSGVSDGGDSDDGAEAAAAASEEVRAVQVEHTSLTPR